MLVASSVNEAHAVETVTFVGAEIGYVGAVNCAVASPAPAEQLKSTTVISLDCPLFAGVIVNVAEPESDCCVTNFRFATIGSLLLIGSGLGVTVSAGGVSSSNAQLTVTRSPSVSTVVT